MDKDRLQGIAHQVKGAVKESLGKIIGDAKLTADGSAERAVGEARNAAGAGTDPLIGMDTDRIKGIGHQIRGSFRKGLGNVIGNAKWEAEGSAERAAGIAQNAAGSGRDEAREALERRITAHDPDAQR